MGDWREVWAGIWLEYLKVLFSYPVAIGVLGMVFMRSFSKEIRGVLERVSSVKGPGFELATSQIAKTLQVEIASAISESAPPPQALTTPVTATPDGAELPSPESSTQLAGAATGTATASGTLANDATKPTQEAELKAARSTAALWEYRYLNAVLVLRTQAVLDWLAKREDAGTPVSFELFDAALNELPKEERSAVFSVLSRHYLIAVDGTLIRVTPKGREYIGWRGPLPPAPAPAVPVQPAPRTTLLDSLVNAGVLTPEGSTQPRAAHHPPAAAGDSR
jgi:hypothetical protein